MPVSQRSGQYTKGEADWIVSFECNDPAQLAALRLAMRTTMDEQQQLCMLDLNYIIRSGYMIDA